jgi:hypothetical protein
VCIPTHTVREESEFSTSHSKLSNLSTNISNQQ